MLGSGASGCCVIGRSMGHAACIVVAGAPATGTVSILNLVGGKHDRQFHRVVRIHFAAFDEWYGYMISLVPGEAHVEVLVIVGSLHVNRNSSTLARDGG